MRASLHRRWLSSGAKLGMIGVLGCSGHPIEAAANQTAGDAGSLTCDDGGPGPCISGWCPLHLPAGAQSNALVSPGRGQVWALGFPNAALLWDGQRWSGAPGNAPLDFEDARLIAGDAWAAGYGGVARWSGAEWVEVGALSVARAIWGSGPLDVWAGGRNVLAHWDGQAWSRSEEDAGSGDVMEVLGLWGAAPNDVWAVGHELRITATGETPWGRILHWNGAAWTEAWKDSTENTTVSGIWGSASDDVWAAREKKEILHWDGRAWSPSFAGAYTSVWGTSPGDVWFIGTGTLLHRAGDSLLSMRVGCSDGPPIAGSGPNDLFITHRDIVEGSMDILHWQAN